MIEFIYLIMEYICLKQKKIVACSRWRLLDFLEGALSLDIGRNVFESLSTAWRNDITHGDLLSASH